MNVRVVYEPTPIRHIAVQCPHCEKWFNGWDIVEGKPFRELGHSDDIKWAAFKCPVCDNEFGGLQNNHEVYIEEVGDADECYKDCLKQKVIWE